MTPVNDPPIVVNPGTQATTEGTTVTLAIAATDADGDALTYAATGLPLGLTIDAGTGVVSGTVAYGAAATNNVVVTASDATLSGTAAFTWTVSHSNRAPVATAQAVTTAEDAPVGVTLAGTDADGDALTYTVVTPPTHGTLSGTAPTLTYTPAANYHGSDAFTFTAHDGTVDSAPATVAVTVTPVNDPPIVVNPGTQATTEGTTVTLAIAATDADGDALTYSATGLPLGLTIDAGTGVVSGTVAYGAAATNNVVVTASDATLSGTASLHLDGESFEPGAGGDGAGGDDGRGRPGGGDAGRDGCGRGCADLYGGHAADPRDAERDGTDADLHAGGELPRAGRLHLHGA